MFRMASESTPFVAKSFSLPSVWRSKQSSRSMQIDALGFGDMDDVEIPAFLRKIVNAAPAEIIATFNKAATKGQGFRQTIRAVTDLSLDEGLCKLIAEVANLIGGPLKAWACYVLWLHGSNRSSLQLTAQARALALDQARAVSPDSLVQANSMFSAQIKAE